MELKQEGKLDGIAGYCGQDAAALQRKACTAAKTRQRWDAAWALCGEDPELAAVAQKECPGMILARPCASSVMTPAWLPVKERTLCP